MRIILIILAGIMIFSSALTYAIEPDVQYNSVRINVNGIDTVQWGENIVFDDGSTAPYSIMYKDTVYLPIRKLSEFMGKYVYWDGEQYTAFICSESEEDPSALHNDTSADVYGGMFNQIDIIIDGKKEVSKGEDYYFSDGTKIPYSILYNGTTYLPMRQLCELIGKQIYWNGDSRTVSVSDAADNMAYICERDDSLGNTWSYYTFSAGDKMYLGVKDEARMYERIYLMAGNNVYVSDDGIFFVRKLKDNAYRYEMQAELVKILFNNDLDSQDGENIVYLTPLNDNNACFSDEYLIYTGEEPGTHSHIMISVYNCLTGSKVTYEDWSGVSIYDMNIDTEGNIIKINYLMNTISLEGIQQTQTFDKTDNKFVDSAS